MVWSTAIMNFGAVSWELPTAHNREKGHEHLKLKESIVPLYQLGLGYSQAHRVQYICTIFPSD